MVKFSSHQDHFLPIILVFVLFFLFPSVFLTRDFINFKEESQTFQSYTKVMKMKFINDHLRKINKPFVKSIQSTDDDIIDCVLVHLQPAFDHPMLKGSTPLHPPKAPNGKNEGKEGELNQVWSSNGDTCPNGTVPIKRVKEDDILRSISISKFGKKYGLDNFANIGHEHAIAYVDGKEYYGAKATLSIWHPNVTNDHEFSLSQIWVISNISTPSPQTIEAGWQVSPTFYGDHSPRFFTYWTNDGYRSGCYNLVCSGFVQTNKNIALGAAISPVSTYNGSQFDITILIWKDPKTKDWWLSLESNVIGYWPTKLFPDLQDHATLFEFGGEVFTTRISGPHTSTQMGSGHFPGEGYKKAAFVRNMEVVNRHNKLMPVSNVDTFAERPNCYNVISGFDVNWGKYIYFGGPGNNPTCP